MFPGAKYLRIIRDGRDVACSSFNERKTWGPDLWNPEGTIRNTRLNALRRWIDWIRRFERWREEFDLDVCEIRYEDLVSETDDTLRKVLDFFGESWSDEALNYKDHSHSLPDWEAGSRDVARKKRVNSSSLARWEQEFSALERLIAGGIADTLLHQYGYRSYQFYQALKCVNRLRKLNLLHLRKQLS